MQLSLVHHYATPSYRSPPLSPTTPLSGRRSGLVPQWCLSLYRQLSECYGYQNVALAFCHFWYHRAIQFCAVHFLSLLLSATYDRVLPVSHTESSYSKNKMQLHALHLWNDSVSLSNKILLSYNFCLELLCLRCMVIVHLLYLLTLEMNSLSTSVICHRCLIIQLVTADMICCFTFEHFLMKPKALREFPEIRIQICVCLCICSIALHQFTKKNVCISIEALQSGSLLTYFGSQVWGTVQSQSDFQERAPTQPYPHLGVYGFKFNVYCLYIDKIW